jgi:hypothetical protein
MKKSHFLKEVKSYLNNHVAGCITDGCQVDFAKNLPEGYIQILIGDTIKGGLFLDVENVDIETLFEINNPFQNGENIDGRSKTSEGTADLIKRLIQSFGRDAFGMYLPFHFYNHCWGIYLFKEILDARIDFLYTLFAEKISKDDLGRFYYYAVYRHELFHYQVERYATKIEFVTNRCIYKPSRYLFKSVEYTEDWLEEALAENSVINSRLITNRTSIASKLIKEIYKRDLEDMPPGYKHYDCKKHKGPTNAHRKLASQIAETSLTPLSHYPSMFSVKNEFLALDKNVPTYLVKGFSQAFPIDL